MRAFEVFVGIAVLMAGFALNIWAWKNIGPAPLPSAVTINMAPPETNVTVVPKSPVVVNPAPPVVRHPEWVPLPSRRPPPPAAAPPHKRRAPARKLHKAAIDQGLACLAGDCRTFEYAYE